MKNTIATIVALLFTVGFAVCAGVGTNSSADQATAPKSYQIRNVKYGDLLRPEDANSANGTRIVLYPAQPWKCMTWKLFPAGAETFQLRNHFTSKTFAAGSTNQVAAPVVQVPFAKEAGARPAWRFVKLSDGTYEIANAKSGQALTAVKEGGTAKIVMEPWSEKPEQKWELIGIDPAQLTM